MYVCMYVCIEHVLYLEILQNTYIFMLYKYNYIYLLKKKKCK